VSAERVRRGASRGGSGGKRERTRQGRVDRIQRSRRTIRRESATALCSRRDALARTHARPLHAMRLRGQSQPSDVNPTTAAREGHATLRSLPSEDHAVDLFYVASRAQPRSSRRRHRRISGSSRVSDRKARASTVRAPGTCTIDARSRKKGIFRWKWPRDPNTACHSVLRDDDNQPR